MSERRGAAIEEGVALVRAQPLPPEAARGQQRELREAAPAVPPPPPQDPAELAPVQQQQQQAPLAAARNEDATQSAAPDPDASESSETLRQPAASLQGVAAAMEQPGSPVGSGGQAGQGQGYETVERLKWTPSLHEQFVAAVDACGGPMQAKTPNFYCPALMSMQPKEILDAMQISGLSLNHVKSHLQKYRRTMGPGDLQRPPGPLPDPKRPRSTPSGNLAGPSMAVPMPQQAQHPVDLPMLAASGSNPVFQDHQQAASDPTGMVGQRRSQQHQLLQQQQQQQQQRLVLPAMQQPTLLPSPQSAFQPVLNFLGGSQPMAAPSALLSGSFWQGQGLAGALTPAVSSCMASEAAPQAQALQLHQQAAKALAASSTLQAFVDAFGLGASQPASSALDHQAQQHGAAALFQQVGELAAQQAASPRDGAMRILQDAALAQQAQRRRGLEAGALAGPMPGLPALRPPSAGQQGRGRPPMGRPRLEEASTTALGQAPGREGPAREARPPAAPAAARQDKHGESANMEWGQPGEGGLLGLGQVGSVAPALVGQAVQVMGMLDLVFRQQLQALGRLQEELQSTIALFSQAQIQVHQHITSLSGIGQALQALEGQAPAGLAAPVPQARSQAGAAGYRAQLLPLASLPAPVVAAALPEAQRLADHGQGSSLGQGPGAGPAVGALPAGGPPVLTDFSPAQLYLLLQLLAHNPGRGGLPY